jgi:hypothetical protein
MSKAEEKLAVWLLKLVGDLVGEKFFGKIILNFENGKVTTVRKEQTLKPPV